MKVIDFAATKSDQDQTRSLENLLGSLKIGRGWSAEAEAQQTVVGAFEQMINNKYFMLRNLPLPDLDMPVPLVLVGPAGIWMLYPSRMRGVYRANGSSWEKIDDRKQSFAPAEENLLIRTEQLARAVREYLASEGMKPLQVEPILVFTNPGIHIEAARPAVRIVQVDALNRFIAGIARSRVIYDPDQVQKMVDLLASYYQGLPETVGFSSKAQARAQERIDSATANLDRFDSAFSKVEKLPFSSRQWLLLGGLILINIIVLVAFVVFILFAN
ncbi:MAG: hypothetical protein ACWGO1_00060 [Anaerolineales bacterium]